MPVPVGSLLCRDRMKWEDGVALKRGEGSGAVDPASCVTSRTSGGGVGHSILAVPSRQPTVI